MSKAVLAMLAKQITKDVDAATWQSSAEAFKKGNAEKQAHYVRTFSLADIEKQIETQLRLLDRGFSSLEGTPAIREAAQAYYNTLMSSFSAQELAAAKAEGSGQYIAVVANYGTLSDRRMKKADEAASAVLNKYLSGDNQVPGKLLAPDHTDAIADIRYMSALYRSSRRAAELEAPLGTSISSDRVNEIARQTLSDLHLVPYNGRVVVSEKTSQVYMDLYTRLASRFTRDLSTKEFDFTVGFEIDPRSSEDNKLDGAQVKKLTAELQAAAALVAHKTAWEAQASSDSFIDATLKQINNAVVDIGGSGKKQRINAEPASVREKVRRKYAVKKKEATVKALSNTKAVRKKTKTQQPKRPMLSLASMIQFINSRLPATVRENMVSPALVNRTGTFANSTRVTGATVTPQGYPSFTYTYQRSPYDVFDRTLGKAPWNTRERDPSALIQKSIREIAQELAIGRFYLKRL